MKSRTNGNSTRDITRTLTFAAAIILATSAVPAAAEPADPAQIDLLRPDRLLVQLTEQDSTQTAGDRYRLPASGMSAQGRGYRNVSRANLLNSPVARYFAGKITGSNTN